MERTAPAALAAGHGDAIAPIELNDPVHGGAPPGNGGADDAVAAQILSAFEQHAAQVGIRAVVMSELAQGLGISTKTLYRHFRSKDQLVDAMLDQWQAQVVVNQLERWSKYDSFEDRLVGGLTAFVMARDRFCAAFWGDLFGSYPQAAARLTSFIREARSREADMLAPAVRPEIERKLIPHIVDSVLRTAAEVAAAAGDEWDREEVVALVIRIWVRGALIPEVTK
jgi:AcrR family transcriptional regulator